MSFLRGLIASGAVAAVLMLTTASADAGCFGLFSRNCCPEPACCAPPPPVSVSWCVQDPCDPCVSHMVTACVPACCANEVPTMTGWRHGFLGRKVLTYHFPGCGHCVEVVLTCLGGTIVR